MTCIFTPDATFTTSTPLPTLSPVLSTRHRHTIFSGHKQCRTQGGGGGGGRAKGHKPPSRSREYNKKKHLITAEKNVDVGVGVGTHRAASVTRACK